MQQKQNVFEFTTTKQAFQKIRNSKQKTSLLIDKSNKRVVVVV